MREALKGLVEQNVVNIERFFVKKQLTLNLQKSKYMSFTTITQIIIQ